jgi:hypothetical protein
MALLCRVSLAFALTALLPAAAEPPWIGYSSNGQATGVLRGTGWVSGGCVGGCLDEIPRTSHDASQKLQRVRGGKTAGRLPVRGASWVCDVCISISTLRWLRILSPDLLACVFWRVGGTMKG